ncbi:MAG: CNNM domain-containing protein, partial [Chthoniobacteraceae bacterium]
MTLFLASTGILVTEWDDGGSIVLSLIGILLVVLLNGFFVACEFSLVKVRASQLDPLVEEGRKTAMTVKHILGHMDAYLSATQFGVTVTSLVLGALGEPYMERLLEPLFFKLGIHSVPFITGTAWALGLTIITFIHIIFGELAPKYLSIRNPLGMSLALVRPLQIFITAFKPFIWLLNVSANFLLRRVFRISPVAESELGHSEEELRAILAESARAHEVSPMGKAIFINALDLQKRVVRDITTPRGDVIFLNTEDSFEENL